MRNTTICNLFVVEKNLETVTQILSEFPVVVKKLVNYYRIQLECDYVGIKGHMIEINYYDKYEKDYYSIIMNSELIYRFTVFGRELTPDDFSQLTPDEVVKGDEFIL